MNCTCDCHKQNAQSKLKKCEDRGRAKDKKIKELEKKLLTLTIVAAIIGTIVGKEVVDNVVEYFETFDKVKSSITDLTINDSIQEIPFQTYTGVSPSPSTLAVLGLLAFTPVRRRR